MVEQRNGNYEELLDQMQGPVRGRMRFRNREATSKTPNIF